MTETSRTSPRIRIFETLEDASRELARALVEAARARVEASGARFGLAVSGGSTPQTLFELLATEHREDLDWGRVHVFWTDERFVPRSSPESNVRLAQELWLHRVDLPQANTHAPPAPAQVASLEEAARAYEGDVNAYLEGGGTLDWVVLGLGEDGHVASLFPGSPVDPEGLVVAVREAPKPPSHRISMTGRLLSRFRQAHVLVAGESKSGAVRRAIRETLDPLHIPSHRLYNGSQQIIWWLDRDAASKI